jgi:GDP-L-fucose synthase
MSRFNADVLVTGSDGLLGHALRRCSHGDVIFATREDADLTSIEATIELFRNYRPRRVIHLAAEVAGIGGNNIHSGQYFRDNILINTNVLETARVMGVEKLISFMSTCIFPANAPYPLNEKDLHLGPPHPSNFGYAYAKRMLEVQSSAYRKEWNCNFICAIPTNMYGPNDYWNLEEGHVLPSIIHKCYLARRDSKPFEIWGTGVALREFVYSDDIGFLTMKLLDEYDEAAPVILSSGDEISIADLVRIVASAMSYEGPIEWDSSKPDGQFRKPSDTSKLRRLFPDFKFLSVEEGVKRTVEWFLKHYPNVRM